MKALRRKLFSALNLALILALLISSVALADDIYNTLDNSVDANYEVLNLVAGGSNGTVTFDVQPKNGDLVNGCNLKNDKSLEVWVNLSTPGIVSINKTYVTFVDCGKQQPSIEIAPLIAGTANISLSIKNNLTDGTFTLSGATFTVNVAPPPNNPPTVKVTGVEDGATYEAGSVPTAMCEVTDAEDGNSSFAASLSGTLTYGMGEQTASCSYTDTGGLTATASATYSIVDTTDPVITFVKRTPDKVWSNVAVEVEWSCSDSGSGVVAASISQTVSTEGANQEVIGTCTDNAGNTASDTQSINIDLTKPTVSLVGGPANGGTYYFGFVPAAPTCSASDALSGLDGAFSVSGYSAAVGSHTVTASVTDKAGNSASASATYTVSAWRLNGFYQPVDMNGIFNTVKGGATVPLKFEVFAGSTELTDVSFIKSLTYNSVVCDQSFTQDEIETLATGGTSLRYDAVAGQFIYNWQTPKTPGKCFRVTMATQDGSSLVAFFKLK